MKPIHALAVICCVLFSPLPALAEGDEASPDLKQFPDEWFWGDPDQQAVHKAMVGKPMPDEWKLADVSIEAFDADTLFKDQIVLIDFWATWCGPCIRAIPKISSLAEKYSDQGVYVLGICCTRGAETMQETADQHDMKYDTAADVDGQMAEAWNVMWWPTYALIDRNGIIRAVGLSTTHVGEALAALLEEQPYAEETAKKEELGNERTVEVSESGDYSINGVTLSHSALATHFAGFETSEPVVIHADAKASTQYVVDLIETLKTAGVTTISIATPAN